MNPQSEIIIDEVTFQLLDLASKVNSENISDVVKLLNVDTEVFQKFLIETGNQEHPAAAEILHLLQSQTGSSLQEIQTDLNFNFYKDFDFKEARKTYALIIGVNSHINTSLPPLDFVKRDTEEIGNVLRQNFLNINVNLLGDNQATSKNIIESLKNLSLVVTRDDAVFVYFAGHLWTEKINEVRFNFLCTYDTVFENITSTSITFDELKGLISNINANRMLMVLDACLPDKKFSSGKFDAWEELDIGYRKLLSRSGNALIAINRAEKKKTMWEETAEYHAMYSSYFLDALEGVAIEKKNIVRVRNIYYFIRKRLLEEKQLETERDKVMLLEYSNDENFTIFEKEPS